MADMRWIEGSSEYADAHESTPSHLIVCQGFLRGQGLPVKRLGLWEVIAVREELPEALVVVDREFVAFGSTLANAVLGVEHVVFDRAEERPLRPGRAVENYEIGRAHV